MSNRTQQRASKAFTEHLGCDPLAWYEQVALLSCCIRQGLEAEQLVYSHGRWVQEPDWMSRARAVGAVCCVMEVPPWELPKFSSVGTPEDSARLQRILSECHCGFTKRVRDGEAET